MDEDAEREPDERAVDLGEDEVAIGPEQVQRLVLGAEVLAGPDLVDAVCAARGVEDGREPVPVRARRVAEGEAGDGRRVGDRDPRRPAR